MEAPGARSPLAPPPTPPVATDPGPNLVGTTLEVLAEPPEGGRLVTPGPRWRRSRFVTIAATTTVEDE